MAIIVAGCVGADAGGQQSTLRIDAERVAALNHRVAVHTLLYGKAKRELASMPPVESAVFEQCWSGGRSVPALARCVDAVLSERDRLARRQREASERSARDSEASNLFVNMLNEAYEWWRLPQTLADVTQAAIGDEPQMPRLATSADVDRRRSPLLRIRKVDDAQSRPRKKRQLDGVSTCNTSKNIARLRVLQTRFDKTNQVLVYLHDIARSNQKYRPPRSCARRNAFRFLERLNASASGVSYRTLSAARRSALDRLREMTDEFESLADRDITRVL